MTRRDAFQVGDRVELLLFYGFHGEPCPRGTVVSIGRTIHCKMDRNGKVVRFEPSDFAGYPQAEGKATLAWTD
jgi:hypothetical protein